MNYKEMWEKDREEWLKPTEPYKTADIYKRK